MTTRKHIPIGCDLQELIDEVGAGGGGMSSDADLADAINWQLQDGGQIVSGNDLAIGCGGAGVLTLGGLSVLLQSGALGFFGQNPGGAQQTLDPDTASPADIVNALAAYGLIALA